VTALRRDGNKITWLCQQCGQPIATHEGYVGVDDVAALGRQQASEDAARKRSKRLKTGDVEGFVVGARLDSEERLPRLVLWSARHDSCNPDPGNEGYWFAVERCDTAEKMLHWCGHLGRKPWVAHTDWNEICIEAGQDA